MSAAGEARAVGLSLYRRVLRVHRTKLPPPMRSLGDAYVKEEFRAARTRATPQQLAVFVREWERYCDAVEGKVEFDSGIPSGEELWQSLSDEQKDALTRLHQEIRQLGDSEPHQN